MYATFRREDLAAMGLRHRELERALRCCLMRVRHGVYAVRGPCEDPAHVQLNAIAEDEAVTHVQAGAGLRGDAEQLRLQISVRRASLPAGAVFSHLSAALIHGLPLVSLPAPEVEAVLAGRSRRRSGWRVRNRVLAENQRQMLRGYPVTTLARTLLDTARDHPPLLSVPMLDYAFRNALVHPAEVQALADSCVPRRYRTRALTAVELTDHLRESPAESVCAVRFREYGITGFRPQIPIRDERGWQIARVDFAHEEAEVIAEVDGEAKYTLEGRDRDESFRAERRREYKLRNLGYRVFRLRWQDLFTPSVFLQIRHAVQSASGADRVTRG